MSRTSGPQLPPPSALHALWRRLTEPAPSVIDVGERRSVRLLATVLLTLVVLGAASAVLQIVTVAGFTSRFFIVVTALLLLAIAYRMSRTPRYRAAGAAAALVPIVAGGAVGFTAPSDPVWFAFMGLGTVIAAGFLSPRQVAAVAGLTVVATALVLFPRGGVPAQSAGAILSFTLILAVLITAVTWHRTTVERARQRDIAESQALYRLLVEHAPVGIGVANAEGRLLAFNDAMLRPGGYTRSDFAGGTSVTQFYADPAERDRLLGQLARDGRVLAAETQMRAKDGRRYDVLLSLVPVTYEGERCVLAITDDVTEQRRAEREGADLATIIERSRNEIYLFDPDTLRFVYANEGARRNLGYTLDQLRSLTPLDLKPAFDEAGFRTLIAPVVSGQQDLLAFETMHQRADGTRYPVEVRLQRTTRLGRQVILAIILDITDRREADADRRRLSAELHAQEQRFRSLIEYSSDLIALIGADARLLYVNPALEQTLGYRPEEWLGRDFRDVVWPDDRLHVEALFAQSLATPATVITWTARLRHADGSARWLEGTGTNRLGDPATRGIVINCRDVTERRRSEDILRQAQKMETVGQLAGGVAHDYNNMLSVILMNAEHALGTLAPDAPMRGDLEDIRSAARRSADLTRQLLAFARKQPVQPRVLDPNEAVAGALSMLRRVIGEDIELTWNPGTDVDAVRMDPAQLEQILLNLCLNARDAIPGVGQITIATEHVVLDQEYCARHPGALPGPYARLTVSDDGSGMDEQVLAKIFEPFFTTKRMGKGTGLGLATVYGIVKQNRGFIEVESAPGAGTRFAVHLPPHTGEVTHPGLTKHGPDEPARGETVLVVEDEEAVLRVTGRILEELGYDVLVADTPAKALEVAGNHPGRIHLLLTDLIMPQMDGRELAARLQSLKPTLKCLYMSGYPGKGLQRGHAGSAPFIQKPFTREELAARVRSILDQA